MTRPTRAEQAFGDLLEGKTEEAPEAVRRMARMVAALGQAAPAGADPRFRARLRSELVARAGAGEEDLFAMATNGGRGGPDEAVAPLVTLIEALRPAARPEPDAAFRFGLRNRLLSEAARRRPISARVAERVTDWNARMRRSARVVVAAGLAATMMLGAGSAFAAASWALPGHDVLYRMKLWRESVQLSFLSGPAEGIRMLDLAGLRLEEATAMADRGVIDPALYRSTFDAMDALSIRGTEILIRTYRETGLADPLERARTFAIGQRDGIARLIERLPPGARPAAMDSLAITEKIENQVTAVLAGCSPCADNPLAPPVATAGSEPAADQGTGVICPCRLPDDGSNQAGTPNGSAQDPGDGGSLTTGDDGNDDGNVEPPDGNDEEPPVLDPVPDVPDTEVDDQTKDQVDGLLDDLKGDLPTDLPSGSLPEPTL